MIQYKLTENEAKMLRGINDYGKASFYELAAMARLTPEEARNAARLLTVRGFVDYIEGNPVLIITKDGEAVRQTLVRSSHRSPYQSSGPSVDIVSESEEAAAVESPLDAMDKQQLDDAFAEEMDKYSDGIGNPGG